MMGFAKKALHLADGRWIGQAVLGKKFAASIDPAGQVVGDYDNLYKVKPIAPIPQVADAAGSTVNAADIARRLAKAAQGRDSTIRTSPAGALYPTTPGPLLLGS